MSAVSESISVSELRTLVPIRDLDIEQLDELAKIAVVEKVPANTQIVQRGTTDNYLLYLLDGQIQLEAADGKKTQIAAKSETAQSPIARLQPRRYDVKSLSPIRLLRLDGRHVENFLTHMPNAGYEIRETGFSYEDIQSSLAQEIIGEIESGKLVLPSLPEVALRIRKLIENDDISFNHLEKVIQTDTAIAAKLIKAANSSLYAGTSKVSSISKAITRMGLKTTSQLVMSFSVGGIFISQDKTLQHRFRELWEHSVNVGAISFVIAKKVKGFDPEKALLAGLLHDIGVTSVISYAQKYTDIVSDEGQLEGLIQILRPMIGAKVLHQWGFPEDFITVVLEAEDWTRNPSSTPDYCDIVLIAQVHSYLLKPRINNIPSLTKLPAFHKLSHGIWDPETSVEFLADAKEEISDAIALLNS